MFLIGLVSYTDVIIVLIHQDEIKITSMIVNITIKQMIRKSNIEKRGC